MKKILIAAALCFTLAISAHAQIIGSNQEYIVSGGTNNYGNVFYVGYAFTNAFDTLRVESGGVLIDTAGAIGSGPGADFNHAIVTGAGSVWSNNGVLYVGNNGAGNSLVISHQGKVVSRPGSIGSYYTASNNSVLVTGSGSVWNDGDYLVVGDGGPGSSLVISNGGAVLAGGDGNIGWSSSDNSMLVTGAGSVWSNSNWALYIGVNGTGNSLEIRDHGKVFDGASTIGQQGIGNSNTVLVTEGSVWNNNGLLIIGQNGGLAGNRLIISDQGVVVCSDAELGYAGADHSSVLVSGSGSV